MRRLFIAALLIFFFSSLFALTVTVKNSYAGLSEESQKQVDVFLKESDIYQAVQKISKHAQNSVSKSDECILNVIAANIYEELGNYSEAQKMYSLAASLLTALNREEKTIPGLKSDDLKLAAGRCALCRGDYMTSEILLAMINQEKASEETKAKIKLYTVWGYLCKAENKEGLFEPVVLMKSYLELDSMKSVRSQLLLTLWLVTGEEVYAEKLKSDFPKSPEAAIVTNKASVLPSPFYLLNCFQAD